MTADPVPEPEDGSGADEVRVLSTHRRLWRGVSLTGRFVRLGLVVAVVVACIAAQVPSHHWGAAADGKTGFGSVQGRSHTDEMSRGDNGSATTTGTSSPGGADCPAGRLTPGWLRTENALPGTTAWQDAKHTVAGTVNGYLNRDSARCGDTVTAYLSSPTSVSGASLSAYRMGYYGGAGGRLIWEATGLALEPQANATVTGSSLLTEAPWKATLTFHVTGQWVPGYYLLVVRAPGQTPSSIPLVVRADGDDAPLGYQASVLTYQAYNTFGGHSAYDNLPAAASTDVSFDRPYQDGGYYSPYQYELPVVQEIEKLGIDTDYFTDTDADADPGLLKQHKGIVIGGHSEYWTKRMYDGALAARQAGVNIAFFGANSIYTAVRLTDSPLGPDRRMVLRRTVAGDPVAAKDPTQATVNWADPPLNRPEASLVGEGYGYLGATGSLRVLHAQSWIFTGTGVTAGEVLRNTVGGEYDQVDVNKPTTPRDVDVLAAMPLRTKASEAEMATTTYYVAPSQAGVFNAGTTYWPCVMNGDCLHLAPTPQSARQVIIRMTDNILTAFATGPAGRQHPSTPSWPPTPEGLVSSAKQPGDVSQRAY